MSMTLIKSQAALLALVLYLTCLSGCTTLPVGEPRSFNDHQRGWTVADKTNCDYIETLDDAGRVTQLTFRNDGPDRITRTIDLAAVANDPTTPHYVILLDGIPYDLVLEEYRAGRLRYFHRPSELIGPFPAMTDLAFAEIYCPGKILASEARWFDPNTNRLTGGANAYLAQTNAPWQSVLNYRVPMSLDAIGYLSPNFVYNHELAGFDRTFDKRPTGLTTVYSVGTSNLGTRRGKPALIDALRKIDTLCRNTLYKHRGRCRITLLADHGHNLTDATRLDLAAELKRAGFHPSDRLTNDNDVAIVEFGLVTSAVLHTRQPQRVAEALAKLPDVDLATYRQTINNIDTVVVLRADQRATITRNDRGFIYHCDTGDPLKLQPILADLRAKKRIAADDTLDDRTLFDATANHIYPDAVARLWRAYHGLTQITPDVMLSIRDGKFCGAADLARTVNVASTHGALNRINTTTFFMSTIRELPPYLRTADLPTRFPEMMPPAPTSQPTKK